MRHGRRWLAVGVTVVAVAIVGIVIGTQNGSKRGGPVSLVLAHATIRAYSSDAVEAVNESNYRVYTSGAELLPRTSAVFRLPQDYAITVDIPGASLAPRSVRRLEETYWPTATPGPGRYWVWTAYAVRGSPRTHFAYTRLTVLAP